MRFCMLLLLLPGDTAEIVFIGAICWASAVGSCRKLHNVPRVHSP